jgi:hypothetical protein
MKRANDESNTRDTKATKGSTKEGSTALRLEGHGESKKVRGESNTKGTKATKGRTKGH